MQLSSLSVGYTLGIVWVTNTVVRDFTALLFLLTLTLLLGVSYLVWAQKSSIRQGAANAASAVRVDILFSHHQYDTDVSTALFKEKLSQSDIFLMEYPAWSTEWEKDINAISRGEMAPSNFLLRWNVSEEEANTTFQFLKFQVENLYQSHIFVTSIDLAADDPLSVAIQDYLPVMDQIQFSTDFTKTLEFERAKYSYFMNLQRTRQQQMLQSFNMLVTAIQQGELPSVPEKPEINILYLLGSNHVRVYDLLQQTEAEVTKEYARAPYTYDYAGELTLKFIAEEPVSDLLLAYGLVQTQIMRTYGLYWSHDKEKPARFLKTVIPAFTLEEIGSLFTTMAQASNPDMAFMQLYSRLSVEKELVLPPAKKEEFDNLTI